MEQLLSKLALSGASFVGKAAFSYCTSLALKKLSGLVDGQPKHESVQLNTLQQKIQSLQTLLQQRVSIINPIIDLIELSCAQGFSTLEPALHLTNELRQKMILLGNLSVVAEPSSSDLQAVVQNLEDILEYIEKIIPLLQLCLQASGTTFSNQLDQGISPNRLLKASSYLSKQQPTVGPHFNVKMYTLFEGSARKATAADWTWTETFPKARVSVKRHKDFEYDCLIEQDLNDGRFHEEVQEATGFVLGQTKTFSISRISKMYYTWSGKLLNIEDAAYPILIIKVKSEQVKTDGTPKQTATTEWIALEVYMDQIVDSDSEDDLAQELEKLHIDKTDDSLSQLSLLEYIIRLCALESREQVSHLECTDQIICQYFTQSSDPERVPVMSAGASPLPKQKTKLMDRFLAG
ncbi:RanGTP-binding protein-domain-containing protein [Gorgonomyces haynaldii]|nr:RanGTP-binding protein-domain-containing protein [Gorgonomyces haynaldii]